LLSRRRSGGSECDAAAVWNQAARPAQQVLPETAEQEAMRGDPAGGFQHVDRAMNKVRRGGGFGDCG